MNSHVTLTTPVLTPILDTLAHVRGHIYCVEHLSTGKQYIGQTRSHRLNHGRYRPYGVEARFRCHVSEAMCNTKHKYGHLLGAAIRTSGAEDFRVTTLETCDLDVLNERERYWISRQGTIYPAGYNLSPGAGRGVDMPIISNSTPMGAPRKRGGCTNRSDVTRAKMSVRSKQVASDPDYRANLASRVCKQHAAAKLSRFAGVTLDPLSLDQYIKVSGNRVVVRIGDKEASFAKGCKAEGSIEENKAAAREFLTHLLKLQQSATLPNSSGNP